MKWPETLTVVRHAESAYNKSKAIKAADPLYQRFVEEYQKDFQSRESRELAQQVWDKYKLGVGDHKTPLSDIAREQAVSTGEKLKDLTKLPDVVFLSPYDRTCQTFELMCEGWPDLKSVRTVREDRLIEQDHGLVSLYNDWRVFYVFYPEQREFKQIAGDYWYRYPQGENVPDVRERIRSWLGTLTRDYANQTVLTITHHLTILSIRANIERLDADEFHRLDEEEKPINCGVTIYKGKPEKGHDGKLELEVYNSKFYK
jgi:broad specificity phosphatase PhoE